MEPTGVTPPTRLQALVGRLAAFGVTPLAFLRLAQVTVGVVALNIVSGAAVRLSDSGLGCPDWPTCTRRHLTAPLAGHRGIEFGNRLVVVLVVVAAAACLVAAWRRTPRRRDLVWLSAGLTAGVLGEAVIGGIVVYSKLNPYVVMTHFLVGMALLTDAVVLALRAGRAPDPGRWRVPVADRRLAVAAMAALGLAVAAGTATTGAGPHAGGKGAVRIPVPLDDMARTHSGIVLVTGALVLALLWLLWRHRAPEAVQARGRLLLWAMVAQGAVGYLQFFTHLPPLLVGVHVLGAATVWTTMVWFVDGLRGHRAEATLGAPAPRPEAVPA